MQEQLHYKNNVMVAAYSGLMFFWLLVGKQLSSDTYTQEEQNFIRWWCQVGNFSLGLLIFILILSGILVAGETQRIQGSLILMSGILISIQILGMGLIGYEIPFESTKLSLTNGQKLQLFKAFLPWVASFAWFRKHNYQAPTWRYKEGQIRWALIFIALVIGNTRYIPGVILGLLTLRVWLLMIGRDCISQRWKQSLHMTYKIYVEEILLSIPLLYKKMKNPQINSKELLSLGQNSMISWGFFRSWKWRWLVLIVLWLVGRWWRSHTLRWKGLVVLWGIWRLLLIGSSPLVLNNSKV